MSLETDLIFFSFFGFDFWEILGNGLIGLSPFVFCAKVELQIKKSKIIPIHRQVKECLGFSTCAFNVTRLNMLM
jgi:hypothetical protein